MSNGMPDFLHRTIAAASAASANEVSVELDQRLLQHILLVYRDFEQELYLECSQDAGEMFTRGKRYGLCSVGAHGICVVGDNGAHVKLPLGHASEYFRLRATEAQIEAIHGLARDTMQMRHERLKALAVNFVKQHTFNVGDTVKWKEGLCNSVRPYEDELAIVLEVLDEPLRMDHDDGSPEAATRSDIVLAVLSDDGELLHYLMDSRRFEPAGKGA